MKDTKILLNFDDFMFLDKWNFRLKHKIYLTKDT